MLPVAPRVATSDVQELQSAVSTFRRSAGQHLRYIEDEVGAAKSKAQVVDAQIQFAREQLLSDPSTPVSTPSSPTSRRSSPTAQDQPQRSSRRCSKRAVP